MKLFTKEIDTKLFEQYLTGSDLENQMVVAKIFNPYGRGTWYLLNSDPEDPEYLWAIVDMDDIEVGSVNRSDLENIRIKPFMLGLERDLSFRQMNALELYEGLNEGKKYLKGGSVEAENKEMVLNNNKQIAHHTKEISAAVKNAKNVPAWVVAKVNRSASDLSDATHYMEGQGESYADGGGIGFIPMDLEEKLAIIAKWGGTNIKGVIGILNAMIDSGLTNNDLKPKPTKNTRFQIERATEKKIQQIWKEIKPNYKGNFEGNKYYSTLKEMISRNWIYEDVLAKFKPFRKYQKPIYAEGGGVGITESDIIEGVSFKNKSGTTFVIDKIELDPKFGKLVSSSLLGGKKGNYRDGIDDFIAFLNEEKAIKYETGGEVESKVTGWKHKKK